MFMLNPDEVLINLSKHATRTDGFKYRDLYRQLYNPKLYLNQTINFYSYNDNEEVSLSDNKINNLIILLKNEKYTPSYLKRIEVGDNHQTIGVPNLEDRFIALWCKNILESIYEPTLSKFNFRSNSNNVCHTILKDVRFNKSVNWFINGNITSFYNNINYHKLIEILEMKIIDKKFIRLIWKFIKAGYLENWIFNVSYSGIPCGGILSPILTSIYFNELDLYVENHLMNEFNKSTAKETKNANPEYKKYESKIRQIKKKLNESKTLEERDILKIRLKETIKYFQSIKFTLPYDEKFKKMSYIRYANTFLIGVYGNKKDCEYLYSKIKLFLKDSLYSDVIDKENNITNSLEETRFLNYNISIRNNSKYFVRSSGGKGRFGNRGICFKMPKDVILKHISINKMVKDIDALTWRMTHRNLLLNLSDLEILTTYNAELRGFYNYYCLAENVSKEMWKLRHVMRLSCLKTLASKHRSTVKHILDKFRIDNNNWGIEYKVKDSVRIRLFYNEGFKIKTSTQERNLDVMPNIVKYSGRSKLEDRKNANCCELCGKDFGEFDVHHKHQIKDLKDKTYWKQIMIAKQRKVLVLCKDCHLNVHFGA